MRALSFNGEVLAFLVFTVMSGMCLFGLVVALGGCETVHDKILETVREQNRVVATNMVFVVTTNCPCCKEEK